MNKFGRCVLVSTALLVSPFGGWTSSAGIVEESFPNSQGVEPSTQARAVKESIIDSERRIWEAIMRKDIGAFSRLVADDLQIVNEDGLMTKSEFAAAIPDLTIIDYLMDQPRVTILSTDVAVITYKATFTVKGQGYSKSASYETTIWHKRSGKWVAVFNQETTTR